MSLEDGILMPGDRRQGGVLRAADRRRPRRETKRLTVRHCNRSAMLFRFPTPLITGFLYKIFYQDFGL